MTPDFLPFAVPDIGEEEIEEVIACLRSGWITTGERVRQFEADFAAFIGGGVSAVSVNSATAGLHLALEAMGIGHGHKVVTTDYTFTATAEVIRYLGADPVLVDVDTNTLNIDVDQVEGVLRAEPSVRAILPVHFAGLACDLAALRRIASDFGVPVLEDAAHALPATSAGHMVGTISEATAFSFYATKTITTAEGGMVVARDEDILQRVRTMRLHGISRDVFDRYSSTRPNWYYEVVAPGFKYNMPDLSAALGIHQLRKARKFHARRQEIAAAYDRELQGLPVRVPARARGNDVHAWHLYVVRLELESLRIGRDEVITEMASRGIGTSVHFIPLHLHPYWRDTYGLRPEHFPVSDDTFHRVISLPIHTKMTDADVLRVTHALRDILLSNQR